jgi:glutathione S-transferase
MSGFVVLVTLGALLLLFWTGILVAQARQKYGVKAPATTGNPDFERAFRVQMNTLEWMPLFLGSLWIFAMYWDARIAAALGLVWIIGRVMYALGYVKAADQRSTGFMVQAIAVLILFAGGLVGAIMSLL